VRVATKVGGPLEARTIVVGIKVGDKSKAWPQSSVLASGATIDQIGDVPVAIIVAPDGKSIRAFDRRVKGQALTFVKAGLDARSGTVLDLETMSEWDFTGKATAGELAGAQLSRLDYLLDYWFDWKTYHPETAVMKGWTSAPGKPKKPEIPPPPS
jgi:hypothetical protein